MVTNDGQVRHRSCSATPQWKGSHHRGRLGSHHGRFAAYETWAAAKAGGAVEKLGLQRVRAILASNGRQAVTALIAEDKKNEPQANAIAAVDNLVRYHRDLFRLVNNFVSFRDFYSRKQKAIFQAGTLYLDQRSCDLCLDGRRSGQARSDGRAGRNVLGLLRLLPQSYG